MNQEPTENKANELPKDQDSIHEAHQDLNEFRATKKTIKDLIDYRMSLLDVENTDFEKINEFKQQAIDAINHLFDEDTKSKD